MSGALLGLAGGIGLLLVWQALDPARATRPPRGRTWASRVEARLGRAGIAGVTPWQLVALSGLAALLAGAVVLGVSRSPVVSLAFAVIAARLPWAVVAGRAQRRGHELREAWPDAVDDLAGAVRAGLGLAESLVALGERGPEALRPAFTDFAVAYRAGTRFDDCLTGLRERLADPVGDRVVASLRLAHEVGGSELGRLLRTLSHFLREDARARAELEARQSWTVNAARLAVVAPWLVLGLLAMRPQAVRAYDSPAGVLVLACGGGATAVAYRLMRRLGRLPEERRVLA